MRAVVVRFGIRLCDLTDLFKIGLDDVVPQIGMVTHHTSASLVVSYCLQLVSIDAPIAT
jgi:hypothetical protein